MNEAVFISDLHLHPHQPIITARFKDFLKWAEHSTKAIYILGDFFHLWLGDDCIDAFAKDIADSLYQLKLKGIELYWMPGNRDFLIGQAFLDMAGLQRLADPSLIILPGARLMVTHGDAYCVYDYAHQILRLLTRNSIFFHLFQFLPKSWRLRSAQSLRNYSQNKKQQNQQLKRKFQIGQKKLFSTMLKFDVLQVVYGHIHRPEQKKTNWKARTFYEYILSDWDASPQIVCYNIGEGLYFLNNQRF